MITAHHFLRIWIWTEVPTPRYTQPLVRKGGISETFFLSVILSMFAIFQFETCHETMVLFVLRTHSSNAHAQPSSGARCLIFGRSLRLLPYFMCANSEGSGEDAQSSLSLRWSPMWNEYHNFMSWLIFRAFDVFTAECLVQENILWCLCIMRL